jgi:hypothetical protein
MSRVAADLVTRSLLCFGIAAFVASAIRTTPAYAPVECVHHAAYAAHQAGAVNFGVVDDMGELTATDVIPLVAGQQFGWTLDVGDEGLHTWREVLITPAAPREWVGADLTIVDEGKVGITERTDVAVGGVLSHAWTITDGDPAGAHIVEVWVDGRLVKRVPFIIVAPH